MYRTVNVHIRQSAPLYEWTANVSALVNNLYNAALFRERQFMTASQKSKDELTANEKEVLTEFESISPKFPGTPKITAGIMDYRTLRTMLNLTGNRDYWADIPRLIAYSTVKRVCSDMENFRKAAEAYTLCPSKFLSRPEIPRYRRKGGLAPFDIDVNYCKILKNRKGNHVIRIPDTSYKVSFGKKLPGKLLIIHVTPGNGIFNYSFCFDDHKKMPAPASRIPSRMIGIDIGSANMMAVVNNCGLPCILYKGNTMNSINHIYNKRISSIISEQTKGTDQKFVPTANFKKATLKRNNRINDCMHKTAKHLIQWCVENRIDTIVIGDNERWKQHSSMGNYSNQKFVQIPFDKLKLIITYLSQRNGIRVIRQEESYTSQASFIDNDFIPVYGHENAVPAFSGIRKERLYITKEGLQINADLNGAANILRKRFPDAFGKLPPDFRKIKVIKHPDAINVHAIPKKG